MESGSVILLENYMFLDGEVDEENYLRKCIVLFEDADHVCVCPVIEQLSSFNAKPNEHYLLPLSSRNGKKLLFAKLSSATYINKESILEKIDQLEIETMKRIINKIKNNYENYDYVAYYEDLSNKISEKTMGVN